MKNKRTQNNRRFRSRLMMSLFIITLILVVVNLVFVNIYSAEDQVYIQQASDLRVLSQEIAKNASEAAAGSPEAFAALEQSSREFQASWTLINDGEEGYVDSGIGMQTALPARAADINRVTPAIQTVWNRVRANADLVLANRGSIQNLSSIAQAIAANIPPVQRHYDEVVNTLLDNNESLSTIAVAQRQAWLSERIALNLNRIVNAQEDSQAAVEQFQRDINLFSSNHEALLEGDVTIGVNRVADPAARGRLGEVTDLFSSLSAQSGNIIQAAPVIVSTARAVEEIGNDSEQLLNEITALSSYFTAARGDHFASPLIGYALLLIILLLTCVYGLEVIRQSRAAERTTAEVNERNNRAVLSLLEEISDLADGDLTVEANVGEEFTGAIADSINYAVGQLRELVFAITDVTMQVTQSTRLSKANAEHLSKASEKQARSIASVSESVREMEKSINQISANASKSLEVAKNSVGIASGGAKVVKSSIQGMDTIRQQIQETSKRIKRLGESSQEIGGFVSLINDIADHTNTLSLNAAIQAAMAGDAGKGFGVVADEVHALAERSSDATRQIETLVKVIQRDINEAVSSMEQTTAEVVQGTKLARGAGAALDDIEKISRELAELVEEISRTAGKQARTATEITGSMEVIQRITTETSKGTRATSDFIFNLGSLTERLQSAVAGFSLSDARAAPSHEGVNPALSGPESLSVAENGARTETQSDGKRDKENFRITSVATA